MVDFFKAFLELAPSEGMVFEAIRLGDDRNDYLARTADGAPVFLIEDSCPSHYRVSRSLRHITIDYQVRCKIKLAGGYREGVFAMVHCSAGSSEFHQLFVKCLGSVIRSLPSKRTTNEIESQLAKLIEIFYSLSNSSSKRTSGLWAELWIIANSSSVTRALEAWHDSADERFDFANSNMLVEVKSTTKPIRNHEFSLEQLSVREPQKGIVASLLLQPLTSGKSILDLVDQIERASNLSFELKRKLWKNISQALGSEFERRLEKRFDVAYAAKNILFFDMSEIPKPTPITDPRITSVRFVSNLSGVASYPNSLLQTLFN
ncbi:PD-(D/E)XK motif protein [Pseudoduganella sp. OTU4001]|uniref:PD-(D/E)XK motif protein n=1 Tax=Pseudoduganella sp. OTU4001 TaxID=3043854 RepID=UPI00313BA04F